MVIDTSAILAILAILQDKPERRAFNEAIEAASERRLTAATFVELSIFIEARLGPEGIRDLDLFLATAEMELVPLDTDQARLARSAISAPWKPSSDGTKKDQSYSPQRLTISRGLTSTKDCPMPLPSESNPW